MLDAILVVESDCVPCDEALEAIKDLTEANEVEVIQITDPQLTDRYPDILQNAQGTPFLAICSPTRKAVINRVYFTRQEEKAEGPSQAVSSSPVDREGKMVNDLVQNIAARTRNEVRSTYG